MTPQDFMDKWGVKRSQLALMLNKSVTTVDHWFSEGDTRRDPSLDILQRLTEIDSIFECWKTQDELIPHLRAIYESSRPDL